MRFYVQVAVFSNMGGALADPLLLIYRTAPFAVSLPDAEQRMIKWTHQGRSHFVRAILFRDSLFNCIQHLMFGAVTGGEQEKKFCKLVDENICFFW